MSDNINNVNTGRQEGTAVVVAPFTAEAVTEKQQPSTDSLSAARPPASEVVTESQLSPVLPAPAPVSAPKSPAVFTIWQALEQVQLNGQSRHAAQMFANAQTDLQGAMLNASISQIGNIGQIIQQLEAELGPQIEKYIEEWLSSGQAPFGPDGKTPMSPAEAKKWEQLAQYYAAHPGSIFSGNSGAFTNFANGIAADVLKDLGIDPNSALGKQIAAVVTVIIGEAGFAQQPPAGSALSTFAQQVLQLLQAINNPDVPRTADIVVPHYDTTWGDILSAQSAATDAFQKQAAASSATSEAIDFLQAVNGVSGKKNRVVQGATDTETLMISKQAAQTHLDRNPTPMRSERQHLEQGSNQLPADMYVSPDQQPKPGQSTEPLKAAQENSSLNALKESAQQLERLIQG